MHGSQSVLADTDARPEISFFVFAVLSRLLRMVNPVVGCVWTVREDCVLERFVSFEESVTSRALGGA